MLQLDVTAVTEHRIGASFIYMDKKIEISKEDLKQKYIVENLSRKECAYFFDTNESYIKRKLKEYRLLKDKTQTNESISRSLKISLDKETLFQLYIIENLTMQECADALKTKFHIIKRRLNDFGIKKSQEKFKEVHRIHSHQTEKSLERRKKTLLRKYGVDNVSKNEKIKIKKEKTTQEHYGVLNPFKSDDIKQKISKKIQSEYGVPYSCMRKECRKYSGNDSKPNQNFAKMLDDLNIKYEREFSLGNYSYDFKADNMLFEINPTIFHNSTFAPVGLPKNMMYHFDKRKVAKEYGYHCVHIFDWDDEEKIIRTFLIPKDRIYARNCTIKAVPVSEARKFLDQNHLQGYARDEIRLGLYYKNELIEIMTFGKPRYNKNYTWELIRLCSIKNVIGGPERLLKAFTNDRPCATIVSYCDLSKFDGKIYEKLGFKIISRNQPSKHWINLKTGQHITDNLLRQKGFDQLFKTNYGKGTSNEQLMLENDFVEVYDCGQLTFVKHI